MFQVVGTEYIRLLIYSVSEIEQTQVVVNYMVQHSQGDRHVLYTVGGHCRKYVRPAFPWFIGSIAIVLLP